MRRNDLLNNVAKRLSAAAENNEQIARRAVLNVINKAASTFEKNVTVRENALALVAGRLDAASPLGIISKGYAKVYRDGKAIASVNDVAAGEEMKAIVSDGVITATVTSTKRKESK